MKTSSLYGLNLQDAVKGVLIAMISAVISLVETSLSSGAITVNWRQIALTALAAGLAYLSKNFFTPGKLISHDDTK